MSAFGGKADMAYCSANVCLWPKADIGWPVNGLLAVYLDSATRVFSPAMSAPGQRQRPTFHIVSDYKRISPDDVLRLIQEREARERADTRTEAQRWLGDPPPDRSALAQRKQT
jgi:hypothetical protein